VDQVADVVDAGVRGGVDLQQVDVAAGIDRLAGLALAAGVAGRATLAVEALGEDARDRGLAHAAGAGEQEGVVDAAGIERVDQGADHVFLAHEFGETLRAPLAGEDEVGHGAILPCGGRRSTCLRAEGGPREGAARRSAVSRAVPRPVTSLPPDPEPSPTRR